MAQPSGTVQAAREEVEKPPEAQVPPCPGVPQAPRVFLHVLLFLVNAISVFLTQAAKACNVLPW